jgi:putative flippase GtrA
VTLLVEVFGVDERIAPFIAAVAAIPVSFLLTRRILTGRAIGSRTLRHRR